MPFNLPVEGGNYTAYVGIDPVSKGYQISEFLNKRLNGKGKIVVSAALPGNSYTAADLGGDAEGPQPPTSRCWPSATRTGRRTAPRS